MTYTSVEVMSIPSCVVYMINCARWSGKNCKVRYDKRNYEYLYDEDCILNGRDECWDVLHHPVIDEHYMPDADSMIEVCEEEESE